MKCCAKPLRYPSLCIPNHYWVLRNERLSQLLQLAKTWRWRHIRNLSSGLFKVLRLFTVMFFLICTCYWNDHQLPSISHICQADHFHYPLVHPVTSVTCIRQNTASHQSFHLLPQKHFTWMLVIAERLNSSLIHHIRKQPDLAALRRVDLHRPPHSSNSTDPPVIALQRCFQPIHLTGKTWAHTKLLVLSIPANEGWGNFTSG